MLHGGVPRSAEGAVARQKKPPKREEEAEAVSAVLLDGSHVKVTSASTAVKPIMPCNETVIPYGWFHLHACTWSVLGRRHGGRQHGQVACCVISLTRPPEA
jgi:hypothetical protein